MRAEASQGFTAFWALSQNSGVVRKAAASLSAISAVTEVRPFTTRTQQPRKRRNHPYCARW